MPADAMQTILNENQVSGALQRLFEVVCEDLPDRPRVATVGIRTRGETLARRLIERLREARPDVQFDLGVLDIGFYRDDISRRKGLPLVRATEIDFDLDDSWVLLVDDVLQTGRSVRAALQALHDFGRPKIIRLAVLIDRGGRELPVSADYVGHRALVEPGQRIQVKLRENDGQEGVYIIPRER
jgi:pyrimidine operon attenuation protein/uracil phosphoribosyltransferase